MIISSILDINAILPELEGKSKHEVLDALVSTLFQTRTFVCGKSGIVRILLEREKLKSTGIGDGLAIPHAKLSWLDDVIGAFGRSSPGLDFDSMDGKPTHFFFLILAPDDAATEHLRTLAWISGMFKNKGFRERLLEAKDVETLYDVLCSPRK